LDGCDLRGSDLDSLQPSNTAVVGAIVDARQAVVIAQNLGLDVRAE
jgi:fluoroquinolone resistance protein